MKLIDLAIKFEDVFNISKEDLEFLENLFPKYKDNFQQKKIDFLEKICWIGFLIFFF
jgi:hypothetical protein